VLRNRGNVFEADQDLDGNELILSPDGVKKVVADNNNVTITSSSTHSLVIEATNAIFKNVWTNDGTGAGPTQILDRASATPANADPLGSIILRGRNSAAEPIDYASIDSSIVAVTDGAETGELALSVMVAGSEIEAIVASSNVQISPAASVNVVVHKTGIDGTTQGIEFRSSGVTHFINSGAEVAAFNRLSSDGDVILIRQASTTEGTISVSGNTVTYGAFTGVHPSWAAELLGEPPGTVICAVDEPYDAPDRVRDRLPRIRMSDRRADPTVYGVYAGDKTVDAEMTAEEAKRTLALRPWLREQIISVRPSEVPGLVKVTYRQMQVAAIGTAPVGVLCRGPVAPGDLLMTSDEPGVAERVPMAMPVLAACEEPDLPAGLVWPLYGPAAVLGKALGTLESDETGLVRAVIWAG
jgi:hypothetical protein